MITTVTLNASVDKLYIIKSFEPGTVIRLSSGRNSAGGKGLNVTRILKQIGAEVRAIGLLGGHNGKFIEQELFLLGIDSDFTHLSEESRFCLNILETSSGRQTEFLEKGPSINEAALSDFSERYLKALAASSVVTLSGSLPPGLDSGYYAHLVALAKEKGLKVILDTRGDSLIKGLKNGPTVVKPNLEEAGELLGREVKTLEQAAQATGFLRNQGAELATVSMGAQGLVAATKDAVYHVSPPKIKAINTVGCGDSLVAGLAAGFDLGWPTAELLKYGVAVSAASAMTMETGTLVKKDLDSIIPLVKIVKLD
ncbi:MAG: 1-phosphofructokinase [Deltaproteobacteria bacterium]|jgi:tagatose 6-phosphate kinase|nr:1-phosphofructokinase [Deltaproteobacteria bacterium]